jgi:membrane associated rhomboid family serine protease
MWAEALALSWRMVSQGETWRFLSFALAHRSVWHGGAGLAGLYVAGRSIEPIIGGKHLLAVLALGNLAAAAAHCGAARIGWMAPEQPLLGTLPLLFTLIGVYGTILPGWRLGAAVSWRAGRAAGPVWMDTSTWKCPPKAKHTAWFSAALGAAWWASGWLPEYGPIAMLAGLGTGWCYARLLGFGDRFFYERIAQSTDLLERRVESMDWEEFVNTELNPVLEKIARHGLRSLTADEKRILRHSRRKLEGW